MTVQPRIAVVIGSTRPARICPDLAARAREVLATGSALRYELLDLADVGLPLLDEPLMASLGQYQHAHTIAWSELVSSYDGFVFAFPQYNWGYPAVLKNALDFLYHEWRDKPATSLTYGTRGGTKGADQLRTVLTGLHMRVLENRIEVTVVREDVDDDWQLIDAATTLAPCSSQLRTVDDELTSALLDGQ